MDDFTHGPTLPPTEPVEPEPVVFDPEVPLTLVTDLIGRYEIDGRIGGGGVGVVYRARHAVLGRPVALKVLRPELSQDGGLLERLRREALSMSRVDSPHVVKAVDYGRLSDGSAYLVMELLEGHDLAAELALTGPFRWERARTIMLQICDALAKAHRARIVHRDLKPENVFIVERADGRDFVKVFDFGLAKVGGEVGITRAGTPLGTPAFMAPEQCAGDVTDARTDVYALGVMLYEMLAGRVPFECTTIAELLLAHIEGRPEPLRTYAPDVPEEVERIVMRCLEKQMDARFPDAAALKDAIESVGGAAVAAPAAFTPPVAPAVRRPPAAELFIAKPIAAPVAKAARRPGVSPLGIAVLVAAAAIAMVTIAGTVAATAWLALGRAEAPVATPGRLLVTSTPDGARVQVDGQDRGSTPIVLPHPEGDERMVLVVTHEGYAPREIVVTARAGEQLRVDLTPSGAAGPTRVAPVGSLESRAQALAVATEHATAD